MALKAGIVGLPNVGKSTLFNCLSSAKAQAANFPFCTIDAQMGQVSVPDERLTPSRRAGSPGAYRTRRVRHRRHCRTGEGRQQR